jgi:hypothetical protein
VKNCLRREEEERYQVNQKESEKSCRFLFLFFLARIPFKMLACAEGLCSRRLIVDRQVTIQSLIYILLYNPVLKLPSYIYIHTFARFPEYNKLDLRFKNSRIHLHLDLTSLLLLYSYSSIIFFFFFLFSSFFL